MIFIFFFEEKNAYEMRISDWSSDVCSSDLMCLFRIVPETIQRLVNGAFVRNTRIEYSEERFAFRPVHIGGRFTGFVPGVRLIDGIIVFLGIVCRIIACLPQVPGKEPNEFRRSEERRVGKGWVRRVDLGG